MAEKENPIWFTLVSTYLSKQWINNGLTIPYIIGAYSLIDTSYKVNDKSIPSLLEEIINSITDRIAVYQFCNNLQEYVIRLTKKVNISDSSAVNFFSNSDGDKTLLIRGFGQSFASIDLNIKYLQVIKESKFSHGGFDGWQEFTDFENKRIKECLL